MNEKKEKVNFSTNITEDDFILRLINIFIEADMECEVISGNQLRLSDENQTFTLTVKKD